MPYFITGDHSRCDGWAVVTGDGRMLGCHETKYKAVGQMVAVSMAEGLTPGGEFPGVVRKHLRGEHDQKSHGSWARGRASVDVSAPLAAAVLVSDDGKYRWSFQKGAWERAGRTAVDTSPNHDYFRITQTVAKAVISVNLAHDMYDGDLHGRMTNPQERVEGDTVTLDEALIRAQIDRLLAEGRLAADVDPIDDDVRQLVDMVNAESRHLVSKDEVIMNAGRAIVDMFIHPPFDSYTLRRMVETITGHKVVYARNDDGSTEKYAVLGFVLKAKPSDGSMRKVESLERIQAALVYDFASGEVVRMAVKGGDPDVVGFHDIVRPDGQAIGNLRAIPKPAAGEVASVRLQNGAGLLLGIVGDPAGEGRLLWPERMPQLLSDGPDGTRGLMRANMVSTMVRAWAESSTAGLSTTMQESARRMYGTNPRVTSQDVGRTLGDAYVNTVVDKFVRGMYDRTQWELNKAGIEYVDVYRGIEVMEYRDENLARVTAQAQPAFTTTQTGNPMSSWSTDKEIAQEFGGRGYIGMMRVPRRDIISTSFTGVGVLNEYEVVTLGRPQLQFWLPTDVFRKLAPGVTLDQVAEVLPEVSEGGFGREEGMTYVSGAMMAFDVEKILERAGLLR